MKGKVSLSRAMSINGNIEFLPSLSDKGFDGWVERGLKTVDQLSEGNVVKSFTNNLPEVNYLGTYKLEAI